jgi:TonB family protein|tara:strand:+ start:123 stop:1157 length:1035 start_codon:yes stop_codon:yes gene_type:complete
MKIVLILLTTVLSLSILSNDSAGEMIDGLRDGIWIDYSADGKVKRIGMYKAGKPSGFWEWYKQDNLLIADGNYLLGEKEGIWNLYFKNKEKRLQLTYKKGDLNGIQKTFYQGGSTECVLGYKDNRLEGYATNYYRNGKPRGEVFYENGRVSGESILLNLEEEVLMVGKNKDGKLVALSENYHNARENNFVNCRIRSFEEPINKNFYSKSKIKIKRNINTLTYIPLDERRINQSLFRAGAFEDNYYPIKQYSPVYPKRAIEKGIEGCVMIQLTVTKEGSTRDVEVLWSVPPRIFDKAAIRAGKKFKYKPRVFNGKAIEVTNVKSISVFRIDEMNKNMNYVPEGCD